MSEPVSKSSNGSDPSNRSDGRGDSRSSWVCLSVVVIGFGLAGAIMYWTNRAAIQWLCAEDGPVESLTALFYFAAAALFVWANKRHGFRNLWFWGYALLFFLIGGEEISWGQRIIGLGTPQALAEINVQGEANFHNIEGIHGSIRMLGLLVVLGICYVVPLADRFVPPLRRLIVKLRHPVFPLWATGIVTAAILLMAVPRFFLGGVIFELDELGEFCLGIAFLIFADQVAREEGKGPAGDFSQRPGKTSQPLAC